MCLIVTSVNGHLRVVIFFLHGVLQVRITRMLKKIEVYEKEKANQRDRNLTGCGLRIRVFVRGMPEERK